MHDRNISLTSKGKGKESMHWQLGWWDLIHSLEGTRRCVLQLLSICDPTYGVPLLTVDLSNGVNPP